MSIKKKLVELLNSMGLYAARQYIDQVEQKGAFMAYADELQKAVDGMSDPARPIVVFGENTRIADVVLQRGQKIIVSPTARFTSIQSVLTVRASTTLAPQAKPQPLSDEIRQDLAAIRKAEQWMFLTSLPVPSDIYAAFARAIDNIEAAHGIKE